MATTQTLLLLKQTARNVASAVGAAMRDDEFVPLAGAAQAKRTVDEQTTKGNGKGDRSGDARLFVVSPEGDWCVVAEYGVTLDLGMATALAQKSESDGWILAPGQDDSDTSQLALWRVTNGQRAEEPELIAKKEVMDRLQKEGIALRLLSFVPRQHLAQEDIKRGKHEDIVLGFAVRQDGSAAKTEVDRALAGSEDGPSNAHVTLSLEQFLERAVQHERVRDIAKAQIQEQLRREGFETQLTITDPQPQGHYCEAFEAESYSFISNGPYSWFDWTCEEACEPRLPEEQAFPACDLQFKLEKL